MRVWLKHLMSVVTCFHVRPYAGARIAGLALDMLKASLEGHSGLRLGNAVHLELHWEGGSGKSGKLESASLGTDLVQDPCPQGIWKPVQCLYSIRYFMGGGKGTPCGKQIAERPLMGCFGNDCCYGNEVGRKNCCAGPRHHP